MVQTASGQLWCGKNGEISERIREIVDGKDYASSSTTLKNKTKNNNKIIV